MGTRAAYPHGTFSWVELLTPDIGAALRFYAGVFGWEADEPPPRGAAARVLRLRGAAVCGLVGSPCGGVPPGWLGHVTVADADGVVARAGALGVTVVEEARDVPGAGRRAVLRDPQGAVVALWEPRGWIGAGRVNDLGCLCMNELLAVDLDAACAVYEGLLGWTTEPVPGPPDGPAGFFLNGGRVNASVFRAPGSASSAWRACFTVESIDRALERVRRLGGTPVGAPVELDHGVIAPAVDPQGAAFAVFAGEVDP